MIEKRHEWCRAELHHRGEMNVAKRRWLDELDRRILWILVDDLQFHDALLVSVLNARSDGLWTRMNCDDLQVLLASLAELVRHIGWPDHDVSSSDFYRAFSQGKRGVPLQNNEYLIIRMEVQLGAFIRGELHPEKRNGNASIVLVRG